MNETKRKDNVRNIHKWNGYYMEDMECRDCMYYKGKKRGCSLTSCCCGDEKLDAIAKGRVKRRRAL